MRATATRLKLSRLDRESTRDMLAALFAEEITPEFLEGIYRETEGNPFFIEEVVKTLVESGRMHFADGRWHRPDIIELGIPQSVKVAMVRVSAINRRVMGEIPRRGDWEIREDAPVSPERYDQRY